MLDFELRIKNRKLDESNFPLKAEESLGSLQYFDHDFLGRGYSDDDDEDDEALEIHWIIKNLWKDVDDDVQKNDNLSANVEENYQQLSKKCVK